MNSAFEHLQRSYRIADAADIALVSLFLYTFFLWFKSTASRQILIGIGILTVVYVLARKFDLYMTATMFQAALAFGAIAAIVVFQEDLRRSFARLALLGRLPRARDQEVDKNFEILIDVAFELARKKNGALFVVRGTELLDRHIRESVPIDALLSKALLDSIFDPHSLGHDGAVVIDKDRVARFAAHLPLSENSKEIGSRGTRHSAALGLSEVSDAFVIVVSEERGQVSVAEGGALRRVANPAALRDRLDRFARRIGPQEVKSGKRHLLIENSGLKLAAIVTACVLWFLTSYEAETVQKTFVVSIEYRNLSETLDIDDSAPTEARLTLTGYERAFNLLAPSTLKVSLDMSNFAEGPQQIAIDESHVKLPSNLGLFRSVPRVVSFGVHTWVKTRLSVEAKIEGRLPKELRQREVHIVPDHVQALIWRSYKSFTTKIYTEPVELGRMTDTGEMKVKLILPQHIRLEADQPSEVTIKLDVAAESTGESKPSQPGGR